MAFVIMCCRTALYSQVPFCGQVSPWALRLDADSPSRFVRKTTGFRQAQPNYV